MRPKRNIFPPARPSIITNAPKGIHVSGRQRYSRALVSELSTIDTAPELRARRGTLRILHAGPSALYCNATRGLLYAKHNRAVNPPYQHSPARCQMGEGKRIEKNGKNTYSLDGLCLRLVCACEK